MATRRTIAAVAALTLASFSYFALTAFILSRSTLQIYGFPVLPDLQSAIEISLQACPMLAALFMILTASFRDYLLERLRSLLSRYGDWANAISILLIIISFAVTTTVLTAAAILTVCGLQQRALHAKTLAWVAFEFTVDLSLIGVFTMFVYSLTRRVWVTLLLFVLYATVVVTCGTRWGVTSFIGFASSVPIRLTSYSIWPLYDMAGWLFRFYWIAVTGLLLAFLLRFSQLSQPLPVALWKQWSTPALTRWKYATAAAAVLCVAVACCLFQVQQFALAKYRGPSPRRLDRMLAAAPGDSRLHIASFDLLLNYEPGHQRVHITGKLTLKNDDGPMRVGYLQLPTDLTLENLQLDHAGSYQLTTIGKYVRIDWAVPLEANRQITLRYQGTIHPAGPFDLTLQAKLLGEAFFFTDADILVEPRQSSCLIANRALQPSGGVACSGENYTMSDMATGTLQVNAPAGFVAVGPGDRVDGPTSPLAFRVSTPQATTFMLACARFTQTTANSTDGMQAVRISRATLDGRAQAETAQAILAFYQQHWPRYRLSELNIVETPTPLGEAVAFNGLLAISDRIVRSRNPLSSGTSSLMQLVFAHEIAHQWWGYQVIPSRAPGRLFVLESFAQFAAYKYLESRNVLSEDAAIQNEKENYRRARAQSSQSEVPLPMMEQDLGLAYHKGPYVLLSLDKILGSSLMDRFGDLITVMTLKYPSPARPEQIVEALIEQLPASSRESARSMLFSTAAPAPSKISPAKFAAPGKS